MRYWEIISEEGLIVPGVNTTIDVKPGEIARQGAKMGFDLNSSGLPPLIYGSGHQKKSSPPKMKKEKGQTFYGKNGTPPNKKAPTVK